MPGRYRENFCSYPVWLAPSKINQYVPAYNYVIVHNCITSISPELIAEWDNN